MKYWVWMFFGITYRYGQNIVLLSGQCIARQCNMLPLLLMFTSNTYRGFRFQNQLYSKYQEVGTCY